MNVRRSPSVVMILPGICSGANGDEAVVTSGVAEGMPAAGEVGVERRIVLISFVAITAGGVGLPDFDQSMRHGPAIFVQHAAAHDDAFAQRLAGMLAGKVASLHIRNGRVEHRASYLGEGMRQMNQRLRRS